jgi:hypothetical protein
MRTSLIILLFLVTLLLVCRKCEPFSLAKKPVMYDQGLLHRSPFDEIDYITPVYMSNG